MILFQSVKILEYLKHWLDFLTDLTCLRVMRNVILLFTHTESGIQSVQAHPIGNDDISISLGVTI